MSIKLLAKTHRRKLRQFSMKNRIDRAHRKLWVLSFCYCRLEFLYLHQLCSVSIPTIRLWQQIWNLVGLLGSAFYIPNLRKKPPELLPRAISCKRWLVLHQLDFTGNDFEDTSLRSIRSRVSLHPDATDEMDCSSSLELVQILDGAALPRDDAEPGSVNDVTSILHVNAPMIKVGDLHE